jgi:hypothetical protein
MTATSALDETASRQQHRQFKQQHFTNEISLFPIITSTTQHHHDHDHDRNSSNNNTSDKIATSIS